MNEEELIEFLKKNLSIEISHENDFSYGESENSYVSVTLKLNRETISSDMCRIP